MINYNYILGYFSAILVIITTFFTRIFIIPFLLLEKIIQIY